MQSWSFQGGSRRRYGSRLHWRSSSHWRSWEPVIVAVTWRIDLEHPADAGRTETVTGPCGPIVDRDRTLGIAQLELAFRERDCGRRAAQARPRSRLAVPSAALAWATAHRSVSLLPSSAVLVTVNVGARRSSSTSRSGFRRFRPRCQRHRPVRCDPQVNDPHRGTDRASDSVRFAC